MQFLCRKVSPACQLTQPFSEHLDPNATENCFRAHVERVTRAGKKAHTFLSSPSNQRWGLFGCGLYSCVLLHLIDHPRISFVVDEMRAGGRILDIPVMMPDQAAEHGGTVLLFARDQYLNVMEQKIKSAGLGCVRLV
jgi:hypothetical protein